MSSLSKAFWYLSVSITVLIFLAFPLSAIAQSGITALPDLNGDGKSDLLWYNPATGQTIAWLMDGTTGLSSAVLNSNPDWKVIKTADLNGDGTSDLILYNSMSGQTVAWIMNGTTVSTWTLLLTEPDWKVIESADLNGDGKADLIWYNASTGQTAAWLMNGINVTAWTVLLTDADWKVVSTADLNGDHKADLIWYNASLGQTAAWLMNGTSTITWNVLITDPDWKVTASADFNGDGMTDLLWYNAALGQNAIWLMNGTSTISWTAFPAIPDLKVVATADLNGDLKADLVWRNNITGQTSVWLMNGTNVSGSATLLVDPNWTVASTADLNHDSKADLLWYNKSTGQTSAWLMNGTSGTSGANLFTDPNWRLTCIKAAMLTSLVTCNDSTFTPASGSMPFNQAPLVNAGADQTITLPSGANLAGNASDDGAPIALLIATWAQTSGPGGVTFGNSSSLQTTAAFSIAGTYTLRLTVNDTVFSTSDDITVVVGAAGSTPTNKAPVVNAGPDQTVSLSSGANLLGAVSDDGLPTGSTVSKSWSKVSGPGTVTFGNASAVTTTASFSAAGTYTLRLTANDTLLSAADDVNIVVNAAGTNLAPVVNAGPDQMITFPASATLSGTASDDGLPAGSTLAKTWSQVAGPGTVTFGNASSLNTTVTFPVSGSYTLRLTANDSALSRFDDVVIVVSPAAPTNQAPVVNAGNDRTIVFPAGTTLAGTATDDGVPTSTLTVSWSKVSGPGTVVFVNANSLNASATFTSAGTYTLRLSASDSLLTSVDDVIVTVSAGVTNLAPVVNAGPNQSITLPSPASLFGSASDDGLPAGSTLSKTWSKVSGPGTVAFATPNALATTATFSVAGTYVLQLSASDSLLTSTSSVTIIVAPPAGPPVTLTAASCSQADVQASVNIASTGDTVVIPAGNCTWTTNFQISKAITLKGSGCTLDAKSRATNCNTIIKDAVQDRPLISWTCVQNQAHRLTEIEFRDGGKTNYYTSGDVNIGCSSVGTTSFRVDHNKFDSLNAFSILADNVIGSFDHNTFYFTRLATYIYDTSWKGLGIYGDQSWYDPVNWGSSEFLFIEDNSFTWKDTNSGYACMDGNHGARVVARFNDTVRCHFELHGTESFQRNRSGRAVEAYFNTFDNPFRQLMFDDRGGTWMTWANTAVNLQGNFVNSLINDRTIAYLAPFGAADGTSPWDVNDAANPFYSGTASTAGPLTVSVAGTPWTPNQWTGYVILKTNCKPKFMINCNSVILSNTANQITFGGAEGINVNNLSFLAGDTFRINKVSQVFDGAGRGGGSLLVAKMIPSLTVSGTTATATLSNHGYSTGDWVAISDSYCATCSIANAYDGTYRITVTGSNTFTYTPLWVPETNASPNAYVTLLPTGRNDQITFPNYEWLNTNNGVDADFSIHFACMTACRENEHYYNHKPSMPFNGSISPTTSSVGVGPVANMPATCTPGVLYWATDEGEWRASNPGPDGRAYKCTATNTWTLFYTPYVYPHPLNH